MYVACKGTVSLLIMFGLFGGCVCDAVHQPYQPAESKPRYGNRHTFCVQCTLLVLVSGYHKRPILLSKLRSGKYDHFN